MNFINSISPAQYCLVMGPWVAIAFVWSWVRAQG